MRLFFLALFVILGANLGIELLDSNMTQMTDNIIDRDELQDAMINQILDDMDIKTMMAILYDNMSESYDSIRLMN